MRVVIACVGTPKHGGVRAAIRDYEDRARRYFRLEVIEVSEGGGAQERARDAEGEALRRRLPVELEWWGLTREGRGIGSRGLARRLGEMAIYALPGVAFVIGGAGGLAADLLADCRHRVSLSRLTLPHELARLVLAEQLYRAGTILRGEPYHRGP